MRELLHFSPAGESLANPMREPETSRSPEISVAGGSYRDPDPNVVEWINNKFKDPDENIQANLMKAFEWAGVTKSIKEINGMMKPLEHTGALPPTTSGDQPPDFSVRESEKSEFMERREKELLIEFIEGDESRNDLLNGIRNAVATRRYFSEVDEVKLINFIRDYRKEAPEFTPTFRILRAMLGIMDPEDPKNALKSEAPPLEETRALAPDVYFMLLQEERQRT